MRQPTRHDPRTHHPRSHHLRACFVRCLLLAALLPGSGHAGNAGPGSGGPGSGGPGSGAPPFDAAQPVPAAVLDSCRGGFVDPAGLAVTLGIERILSVDGRVVERGALQFGDLGRLAGGAGLPLQSGRSPLDGSLIQNSLNGRTIGSTTILHATVDTHGAFQAMQFQSTLANALTLTLGRR